MSFKHRISNLFTILFGVVALLGLFQIPGIVVSSQEINPAPVEPICQLATTSPSWNPYPITTSLDSPDIVSNTCKDMPLLSHFPVDFRNNNPREKTIVRGQSLSFQLYYNNGAKPDSSGDPRIDNPNLKLELVKESETRYRLKATLSGSNVSTATSAQKGGDLIINTPANTQFKIVGRDTRHFIDAIERKYAVEEGRRADAYDFISDNSREGVVSNPIWSSFPGVSLPTTTGYQIKPRLEAGFLGYGYILFSVVAVESGPVIVNLPPVLPGEEITIVRGQSGSFQRFNGSDPDNNYPLTYNFIQVPDICTRTAEGTGQNGPNRTGPIITCQTDANTPARFQFPVTPIDALGLAGTPGIFIVNVIEPKMTLTKECFVKGTQTACDSKVLKAGDQITYKINVTSTGTSKLTNLRIVDNYDKAKLTGITNISDSGQLGDGVINWSLGDLNNGSSKAVTFDATIANGVKSGDVVVNTAVAKADGVPDLTAKVQFPIGGGDVPVLITSNKLCFKLSTTTSCANANLKPNESVKYQINVRNTGTDTAKNVRVVDTYDRVKLTNIRNLTPQGTVNTADGKISWNLGDLAPNQTKTIEFEATIVSGVVNNDIIINNAVITADNLPDQFVSVQFPISLLPPPPVITPRTGGAEILSGGMMLSLVGFGYYYIKNPKWATGFVPKRSSEVKLKESVRK